MFQRVLLSIVLAFAIGANASLLCDAWCHPAAAAAECHHESPSTLVDVAADDGCNDVVLGVASITREYLRRGVSNRDTANAVVAALFRFVDATASIDKVPRPAPPSAIQRRPLVTVLRI